MSIGPMATAHAELGESICLAFVTVAKFLAVQDVGKNNY